MNVLRAARQQWDRVGAWVAVAAGAVAIVVGWRNIGQEVLTAQQLPYLISGGIGGLFLLGVGAILWISADLRDEWRKLDAIERHLADGDTRVAASMVEDVAEVLPPAVARPRPKTGRRPVRAS